MQATMVGVLLSTLGGAALLGRSRQQRWAVELNAVPHLTQRLSMKLPKGWQVDQTPPEAVPLVVRATHMEGGEAVRVLAVAELPTAAETGDALLADYLTQKPGVTTARRPIEFLGRSGVVVEFTSLVAADDVTEPAVPMVVPQPQWYAATVIRVPGARPPHLGIVVALIEGPGGPSGERVVRQVAGALALRARGERPGMLGN